MANLQDMFGLMVVGTVLISTGLFVIFLLLIQPIFHELRKTRESLGHVMTYAASMATTNTPTNTPTVDMAAMELMLSNFKASLPTEPHSLSVDALEIEVEQLKESLANATDANCSIREGMQATIASLELELQGSKQKIELLDRKLDDANTYLKVAEAMFVEGTTNVSTASSGADVWREAVDDVLPHLGSTVYEVGVYNGMVALANAVMTDANYDLRSVPKVPVTVMPNRDTKGRFLKPSQVA